MATSRREFLGTALAAGAVALLAPRGAQGAEAKIDVLVNEPIGTISPNLYSHFIEHLGGVVYDGIWVGEKSKVPNIGGIRRELVEYVRRIKPGVMRWPGGCFADQYDWRDGIGPREKRPRRVNFWADTNYKITDSYKQLVGGPQKYEPNWFGTSEFMHFCRLTDSQPYFAANVRSLDVLDFLEWVEYCNAPTGLTTLSDMRAAAGDREPYNVTYWGVGNESWGCGGDMTPEEYADRVPPLHRMGADLSNNETFFHCDRAERRRCRLDAPLFHQARGEGVGAGQQDSRVRAALLLWHDGEGQRPGIHGGRVVRADPPLRPHGVARHAALVGDGRV